MRRLPASASEKTFEHPADTLADFAGSFYRSDGDIFTRARGALADGSGGIDRMQSHKIDGAFTSTLRDISRALRRTEDPYLLAVD